MAQKIQLRRGTITEWTDANPMLAQGEFGLEWDPDLETWQAKIGDGTNLWADLPYWGGSGGGGISGNPGDFVIVNIDGDAIESTPLFNWDWADTIQAKIQNFRVYSDTGPAYLRVVSDVSPAGFEFTPSDGAVFGLVATGGTSIFNQQSIGAASGTQFYVGADLGISIYGENHIKLEGRSAAPTTSVGLGSLYVDSDDNKLYFNNGTTWVDLTASGGGGGGSLPNQEIGYGDGTAIVSTPQFTWNGNTVKISRTSGGDARFWAHTTSGIVTLQAESEDDAARLRLLSGVDTGQNSMIMTVGLGNIGTFGFNAADTVTNPEFRVELSHITTGNTRFILRPGCLLLPLGTADPVLFDDGSVYYDTDDDIFKFRQNGVTVNFALDSAVVHLAGTETITGLKTFRNSLTVQNIQTTGTATDNATATVKSNNRSAALILDSFTGNNSSLVFYENGAERGRILGETNAIRFRNATADVIRLDTTAAAPRFQADFNNATHASRLAFQASTTNADTAVPIIPNGTSQVARLQVFNSSSVANCAIGSINVTASEVTFGSTVIGSGTVLPMTFFIGTSERLRIATNGAISAGALSADNVTNLNIGSLTTVANTTIGYPAIGYNIASGNAANKWRFAGADNSSWIQFRGTEIFFYRSTGGPVAGGLIAEANSMIIDNNGVVKAGSGFLSSGGGIGYTAGAGGTVTQITSKATNVTLNKTCGTITMHNQALAAGTAVAFQFVNSFISQEDIIVASFAWNGTFDPANYTVTISPNNGAAVALVVLRNVSGGSLSDPVAINFAIIKGIRT